MKTTAPSLRINVAALSVLQMANYLIPLLTIPFLTRVLGIEAFGKIALVQVTMQFCILLADYGFSWSTTSQIAARRHDNAFVSRTFIATWAAQWLLLLLTVSLLYLSTLTVPFLQQDSHLYLIGLLFILGHVLFPMWLLQGLERLMAAAVIQLIGRLLTLPLLFILVSSPRDIEIAIVIIGIAPVVTGLTCLLWIRQQQLVQWQPINIADISSALREGGGLFLSKISISGYAQLIPMLIGILSGPAAIAYFSLADRARRAVQSLLLPLSQAMFPRMSHLFSNEPDQARRMLRLSLVITLAVSVSASLGLWFGAHWIILLLGGEEFLPATQVLRWLAFVPVVVGLSNIFGTQIMIPNKMTTAFNLILAGCAAIGLIIAVPLILGFAEIGGALALLATEIAVTALMLIILIKKGFYQLPSSKL